jgi:NDP-sugar pyrophosphorylase family protein
MKAVILAGGKGTRLRPFTYVLPKPLVPVGEKPILAILIDQLKKNGIEDITLCVNQMAELIMAYFGDGSKFGVKITYSMEQTPLGTIGPLKLIPDLPDIFFVMNGDLLTDMSFTDIYNFHIQEKSLITVGCTKRETSIDFGVMKIENQLITSFQEKPRYNFSVSMGIYVFNRQVLSFVPENQKYGFDDLMHNLLNHQQTIQAYIFDGFWLDIGRIEDFQKANDLVANQCAE